MEVSKRIKPLMEYAERVKTDQTIPKKWAKKLLVVNRGLIRELRKYDEAVEILRGSKHRSEHFLKRLNKGEITEKQYLRFLAKFGRAKQQADNFELFTRRLSKILEKSEGKKD